MAKIILNDGSEEYLSPGAAGAKVAAGEARWAQGVPMYSTRQLVAEPAKKRRKRKPKPEPEPVEAEEVTPATEPDKVDADETE